MYTYSVGVKDHAPAGTCSRVTRSFFAGLWLTGACVLFLLLGAALVEGEELPKAKEAEPELYTVTSITSVALRRGYTISNIDEAYMVRTVCQLLQCKRTVNCRIRSCTGV
jgi:hypothetical protein